MWALLEDSAANTSPRLLRDLLIEQASLARCPSACDLANRSLHSSTGRIDAMHIKCNQKHRAHALPMKCINTIVLGMHTTADNPRTEAEQLGTCKLWTLRKTQM